MPEPPSADLALHLDLSHPEQRLVRATLRLQPRATTLRLHLPAWTPGSYLIRDYVRTLEGLEVLQGSECLPVKRLAQAVWEVTCQSQVPLEVRWRILATELSVRTCHLTADHGFLALAGVVLQVEGERWTPIRLNVALPRDWQAFIPLPGDADAGWLAKDFDTLIDSPLEVGPHACHPFSVAGVPHRWVCWGDDLPTRDPKWLEDVKRVGEACCRLMGDDRPPADSYLFILHLLEQGYGGLEHDQACVLQFGRRALAEAGGRRRLLQLVAHEYLHQWNVRRLRPAELSPIDYDRPCLVPTLWFAEGVTSYYDQLLPVAAGLVDEKDLLEDLGADLSRYQLTPGRTIQSLRLSSQEAWVKLYRPDPHSPDCQISYYLKGAVLALVLDLHLRRHGSSLAAVLRDLWRSHGRQGRGYSEADLLAAFSRHAPDLSTLLPIWLESCEDPPIDAYLNDVGLVLSPEPASHHSAGWQFEAKGTCLARVIRGGPAERAGLQVADEVLAIDHQRLRNPEDSSFHFTSADERSVLFCRDGRVRETKLRPDGPAIERWRLRHAESAGEEAAGARARWLALLP